MMKKVLLLVLVISSFVAVKAQKLFEQPGNYKNFPSADQPDFRPSPSSSFSKQGGQVGGWFDPEDFIRNNATGPFTNFVSLVFPDSTVVNVDQDNKRSYVFSHSWGHLYDLRHENWAAVPSDPNAPIMPFGQKDSYSWDSVGFLYLYRRNYPNPNVVDTCYISFYKNSDPNAINGANIIFSGTDTMLFATVTGLDQQKLAGTAPFMTKTILLTEADTTGFGSTGWQTKFRTEAVGATIQGTNAAGISRNPNSWFAYTVTFKPGHPWNPGDTIESRGLTKPANGINYFGYRYVDLTSGVPSTLRSRNYADNSLVLYNITRYGQTYNGFTGFMPGTAFGSYVNALAFVSGQSTVSAKEVAELGFSLGKAYPVPAVSGQTLTIEYGLKTSGNVTIEIFDLLGKNVATVVNNEKVDAGDHTATTALNLNPGVYMYTLKSGDVLIGSKKFTVAQ